MSFVIPATMEQNLYRNINKINQLHRYMNKKNLQKQ